jgi:YbbR domain-containing protein
LKLRRLCERLTVNWPAKLASLAAAAVLFFFYHYSSLEERSLSVPLKLNLPAGLAVATPYPKAVRVTLRGKAEDISGILEEDISVSGDLRRFDAEGQYRLSLRVTRAGSALKVAPLIVKVEPAELRLVLEKEAVKSVRIVPVIKGEPAHGYELAQYGIRPDTVEVSGPRTAVQALKEVNTEEVDVTGSSEDFSFEIPLARGNPLIRYPRESAVMFQGVVRPMEEIRNFEQVEIIGIDLAPDLAIAQPLPKGSIRLQGSLLAIEAIPAGSPKLILDCRNVRRPGTARLATKPDVPAGLIVLKYEPLELAVSFISKGKEVIHQ